LLEVARISVIVTGFWDDRFKAGRVIIGLSIHGCLRVVGCHRCYSYSSVVILKASTGFRRFKVSMWVPKTVSVLSKRQGEVTAKEGELCATACKGAVRSLKVHKVHDEGV
jgi:hypothetical protein